MKIFNCTQFFDENMMDENKALYDYQEDMRTNKWSGKQSLEKVKDDYLPGHIIKNKEIYKNWLVK